MRASSSSDEIATANISRMLSFENAFLRQQRSGAAFAMHDLACANAIALDLLQGVAENFTPLATQSGFGSKPVSDNVSDLSAFPWIASESESCQGERRFPARTGSRTKVFWLSTAATTSTASAGLIRRLEIASAKQGCRAWSLS
jgi:hypothetical protein